MLHHGSRSWKPQKSYVDSDSEEEKVESHPELVKGSQLFRERGLALEYPRLTEGYIFGSAYGSEESEDCE
ncbi:hypothetical protein Hypma_010748 [Hypsizygus marmoreus]|uniref:Uncharacterized protein n=1 Tax=Hypsizygus marmoreus TaxID=39966 RepID=A0A369JK53_HYPMA|nr:hypothetical protein Hypma_010748 [Hypsizygus marmoreus]